MASFHHRVKRGLKGSAAQHASYITRQGFHAHRDDLVSTGHGNMPGWAQGDPSSFWRMGDRFERANGAVYREHEIALPSELTIDQQLQLVVELVDALTPSKPYQYAVHAPCSSLQGETNTHLHLMYSDRLNDGIPRAPENTFRRYNASRPHDGGARKVSCGKSPSQLRDDMVSMRKLSADLQNRALERAGSASRVDHRSLKEQGITRVPERHLGQARIRSMTKAQKSEYVEQRKTSHVAS